MLQGQPGGTCGQTVEVCVSWLVLVLCQAVGRQQRVLVNLESE
jgi:hypothetical protein